MQKVALQKIIDSEKAKLNCVISPIEKVNILYNLIAIKQNFPDIHFENNIYVDIKALINNYVDVVKSNDYGYDFFCYSKLFRAINQLNYRERLSVLNYLNSTVAREFPDFDRAVIIDFIKKVKIEKIVKDKDIAKFPQAFILFSSLDIEKLLLVLAVFFILTVIILLPAPFGWMELFEIDYHHFSNSFILNHILNIFSLFGGFSNGMEIIAINSMGVLLLLVGKIAFVLLIVNFVYKKIADKISIK